MSNQNERCALIRAEKKKNYAGFLCSLFLCLQNFNFHVTSQNPTLNQTKITLILYTPNSLLDKRKKTSLLIGIDLELGTSMGIGFLSEVNRSRPRDLFLSGVCLFLFHSHGSSLQGVFASASFWFHFLKWK